MHGLHLKRAVHICEMGGIIAYPTEAVFGLGCLPFYEQSVRRLLFLKRRSMKKGLICVAADMSQLECYVDFDKVSNLEMISQTWPGPVTWLIPAQKETPYWLIGSHSTLAVRVSANPLVQSLCKLLGPIVSTSANPHGSAPAYNTQRVRSYFRDNIDYILPGNLDTKGNPTEIRDGISGDIVRAH